MDAAYEETEGLTWLGSRAVYWRCSANTHIYAVWVGSAEPQRRLGLKWLPYRDGDGKLYQIQVHEDVGALDICSLDFDC